MKKIIRFIATLRENIITAVRNTQGITLVEILVVLAIIAILGSVIIPRFMDAPAKARVTAAKMQINALALAVDKYYLDKGRYPDGATGLQVLVDEKYLKSIPLDPWGRPYIYRFPGNDGADSYAIISLGADGQEGGDNLNADIRNGE